MMFKTLSVLSGLVAVSLARPQVLPAGLSAAECFNYPFCGPTPDGAAPALTEAQAFEAQLQRAVNQIQFDVSQPIIPDVPGNAAHAAAEARILALQGRVPQTTAHAGQVARVQQAEAALIALQQQQASVQATAFTGLVGPSGVVGPSGLVGPAGSLAF